MAALGVAWPAPSGVDDRFSGILDFGDGVVATLTSGFRSAQSSIEAIGSTGSLFLDDPFQGRATTADRPGRIPGGDRPGGPLRAGARRLRRGDPRRAPGPARPGRRARSGPGARGALRVCGVGPADHGLTQAGWWVSRPLGRLRVRSDVCAGPGYGSGVTKAQAQNTPIGSWAQWSPELPPALT